ncbi:DUF397 domain-containing protein [Streptomyces sp. NBC_00878]|uniref:DUF397 domain-containing protein n=1 Tax=Streptomyces sp. NBC_00878 TaxID=2975854 RepID=UPI0022513265|nr:DUF397 domain-containing protein [Streptomyces sp. NBC_00878]MCX4905684.1 DUF397 domain-containing protein [Streptomyces sp. NBC_00878]
MTGLRWQKSTYSEGGADTCVEVALDPTGTPHLRESDTPGTVIATAPSALAALLDRVRVKGGELPGS